MEKIKEFLNIDFGYGNGYGYGDGSGYGDGYGSGDGSGYGDGYGSGYGDGDGDGDGYGDGYGSGDGSGYGDGYGSGSGYGDGDGDGYGDGSMIKMFFNYNVYMIDGIQTIIKSVRNNVAKGFILQSDLTLTPCYIVKQNNIFSHGDTLHYAMESLHKKLFNNSEEERISEFVKSHKDNIKYSNQDLFDWHGRLTGSCLAGRNAFVKDRGIDIDGESTVEEFIKLTENDYGGNIIKKLKEFY